MIARALKALPSNSIGINKGPVVEVKGRLDKDVILFEFSTGLDGLETIHACH